MWENADSFKSLGEVNVTGAELSMGVPTQQVAEPKDDDKIEKGQVKLNNGKPNEHLENQEVDLIGNTTHSTTDPQMQSGTLNIPRAQTEDRDARVHGEDASRPIDLPAPSREESLTTCNQAGSVKLASHSPLEGSSEEEKAKSLPVFQCDLNSTPLNHSNDCGNNNGMDSATDDFLAEQEAAEDKPELQYTIKHLQSSSPLQPRHDNISSPGKDMAAEALDFGPSDVPGTVIVRKVGNNSLHVSEYSGSNHTSDEQSMSSSSIGSSGEKEGSISPIEVESKSAVDQNHIPHRRAALNRFHQKRKERCFEKTLRYKSMKKLADQRP